MQHPVDRRECLRLAVAGFGLALPWVDVACAAQSSPSAESVVPNWVPVRGGDTKSVATTNSFQSQNGKLAGWEYAFGKIIDDYSGGVYNPYWGPFGAMVFHGGGHSATFDNSVVILDLNDRTFKRLSNPTPGGNGANWIATTGNRHQADPAFNLTYCEYGDGQPGAAHTYDTLAILPPADGGAPFGSLIRVSSYAVHVNMSRNTGFAHRFDFHSTAMRDGKWHRWSVNGPTSGVMPGACSAYDPLRKRFWWISGLSSAPPMVRYLEVSTQKQQEIRFTGGARVAPAANPDSATMRYDPVRDTLVLTCTVDAKLVLAFLRCESPERGWVVARLSAGIPAVPGASHPFDFVAETDKFVLLSGADTSAVYDIVPSQELTYPWRVTRRPVVGVSIPRAYVAGKRWSYSAAVKSFVWMARSSSEIIAYRPVGI